MKTSFKDMLPEYPSLRHLPWKPNSKGDKIATEQDVDVIFEGQKVYVQEKIDGANCGMGFLDGHPVVRTRTKILRKGQELKNPSQKQFASAWNWMHDRKDRFDKLDDAGPYAAFGEWMVQQHGMVYDKLPEWFVAYDVYDYEKQHFLDQQKANTILEDCGFETINIEFGGNLLAYLASQFGSAKSYPLVAGMFESMANMPSYFAVDAKREGIVVKVSDGEWTTDRFKMVRQGFDQGCLLGKTLKKNKLAGE